MPLSYVDVLRQPSLQIFCRNNIIFILYCQINSQKNIPRQDQILPGELLVGSCRLVPERENGTSGERVVHHADHVVDEPLERRADPDHVVDRVFAERERRTSPGTGHLVAEVHAVRERLERESPGQIAFRRHEHRHCDGHERETGEPGTEPERQDGEAGQNGCRHRREHLGDRTREPEEDPGRESGEPPHSLVLLFVKRHTLTPTWKCVVGVKYDSPTPLL